jgi:uncharacterized protein
VTETAREEAHFPAPALLDAYGNGGFRFADMSHRGSILCLPSGIWSWSPVTAADFTRGSFIKPVQEAGAIEMFLIGTGDMHVPIRPALADYLREAGLRFDIMPTGAAARTYNVLLGDQRKVAAALIAVDNAR